MNDFPLAIDSASTKFILRVWGFGTRDAPRPGCSPHHQPGNKRIPQITHLISLYLLLWRFLDPAVWGRQLCSFLTFVFTEMGIFERGPEIRKNVLRRMFFGECSSANVLRPMFFGEDGDVAM